MNASRRAAHRPSGGRWLAFVQRFGWRAYAVPILTVVTVVALVRTAVPASSTHVAANNGPASTTSTTSGTSAPLVQVEGLTAGEGGFAPASTPAPVMVSVDGVTSCATNGYPRLVLVSISHQHLWACSGHQQVDSTAVTTGRTTDDDRTPLGSWRVQAKQRDRYLVGPGYQDYVKYWVPFNGDFGFHDASWQTMPFGSAGYTTQGSHGCVHLPTTQMAWLYGWATVDDTVVTIEA